MNPKGWRVFASTASFFPGGGLAVADAQCQADAAAALPGSYRAMLATSTASMAYGGWSGSTSPQMAGTLATCNDWASTNGNGIGGRVQYTDFTSMQAFDNPLACTNTADHLYCLQQ